MTAKSSLLSRCSTVFSLPILPMGFLLVLAAGLIGCTAGASTDPNAPPVVTAICPASITAGGPDFTLEIDGSNFGPGSVVLWNGTVRRTTYQCPTQMRVAITAADIAAPGTAQVVVTNPARGTSSGILTFTIASATNPVPTLTSLRPSTTAAGGPAFTLTLNGSNFVSTSVVSWNGSSRPTIFVSATQLTAAITAADIASVGTANVTVSNPAPGGGTSGALPFTISAPANPVPTLTSLLPSSATAGSAAFTLTVNGAGFIAASVVQWNGANRTTTFVSATQLTAAITAADIASVSTANVTVSNPAPGGGTSGALPFTISAPANPVPALTSLSPSSATAGSAAFTLTVNGTGFIAASVVQWNGANRTTTFVSATQLTAAITAADIASVSTANVTVSNPAPGGGTSGALPFTISAPANPVPTLTSLSPSSATAGSAAFTLTVNGTGFIAASVVQWNGSPRTTTFVNSTQVTAQITAADVASAGSPLVTVVNPAPGGGTSNALTFTVSSGTNPVPVLTFLSPMSAPVGGAAFTLTLTGTGFIPSSTVIWGLTQTLTTTFVSATQLTAQVPASLLVPTVGSQVPIVVSNPAPGGGFSNDLKFAVPLSSNASFFNGYYIFSFSGYDAKGPVVRTGVFVFFGDGTIGGGRMDSNSQSAGPVKNQTVTGTYTVNLDWTGQIVANGVTYRFVIDNFLSSMTLAQHVELVEFDDANGTGTRGSGTLIYRPTLPAVPASVASLAGDYAFGGQGTNTSGQRSGMAGRLTLNTNGTFSNGQMDLALPGAPASNVSAALAGSFSDPDLTLQPYGRITVSMSLVGVGSFNLVAYLLSGAPKFYFIDVDNPGTFALFSGTMFFQNAPLSVWDKTALSNTDRFALTGVSPGGSNIAAGSLTFNGNLGGTGTLDQNNAGTTTLNAPLSAAYTIGSGGRGTLTLSQGLSARQFTFYLISQDQGYLLEGVPGTPATSFQTGFLGWGNCTLCTSGSLTAVYGMGSHDPALPQVPDDVTLAVFDGFTNSSFVTSQSTSTGLQTSLASEALYSVDSAGRVLIPGGSSTPDWVFWIAPGGAVGIPTKAGTTSGAVHFLGHAIDQVH